MQERRTQVPRKVPAATFEPSFVNETVVMSSGSSVQSYSANQHRSSMRDHCPPHLDALLRYLRPGLVNA